MLSRRPQATIDLTALEHNFNRVKQLAPQSKVLAVLKANAYGHGMLTVAQALKSADALGVARIDEALALRAGGITKPIVLLEGFFDADELPLIVEHDFWCVVHSLWQLEAIEQACLLKPLTIWLKLALGLTSPLTVAVARKAKSLCTSTTASLTGPSPNICTISEPLNLMLDCISTPAAAISPSSSLTGAG